MAALHKPSVSMADSIDLRYTLKSVETNSHETLLDVGLHRPK